MGMMSYWDGRVVVVTGATGGVGGAVCRRLRNFGAVVHGIGRNEEALSRLPAGTAHRADLAKISDLSRLLVELPPRIDAFFHLAGSAPLDDLDQESLRRYWDSDFLGPVELAEDLLQRMPRGGHVAMVTSMVAALGDVRRARDYRYVKQAMVRWCDEKRDEILQSHGAHVTLVSMGLVRTGIWTGMPENARELVGTIGWSPERAAAVILEDVAAGSPVSYPGTGARLAPIVEGKPRPNFLVKSAATWIANAFLGKAAP